MSEYSSHSALGREDSTLTAAEEYSIWSSHIRTLFTSSEFYSMYDRPLDSGPLLTASATHAAWNVLQDIPLTSSSHTSPESIASTIAKNEHNNLPRLSMDSCSGVAGQRLRETQPGIGWNAGKKEGSRHEFILDPSEDSAAETAIYPWCFYRRMMRHVVGQERQGHCLEDERKEGEGGKGEGEARHPSTRRDQAMGGSSDHSAIGPSRPEGRRSTGAECCHSIPTDAPPPPPPLLLYPPQGAGPEEDQRDRYSSVSEAFYAEAEAQDSAARLASHLRRKQKQRVSPALHSLRGTWKVEEEGYDGTDDENNEASFFSGDARVELQQAKLMEEMTELLLFVRQHNQLSAQLTQQLNRTKLLLSHEGA